MHNRRKQAPAMASQVLYDCEALTVLRFGQLRHHFLKSGYCADISISKVLSFVQGVGLLNA
jgi:hypothetical protein